MGNPTGIHWRSNGRWRWVAFVVVLMLIFSPLCSPGGRGFKGKTWWDWLELAGVPLTLAGFGFWFQHQQRRRDSEERAEQRENAAVTEFIQLMQPLLLEKNLKDSPHDAEVRNVARALTLATLSQMKSEEAPARRTLVIRFLLDSGLNVKPGNLFSLSNTDLSGVFLPGVALIEANLIGANLRRANLTEANLSGASLHGANLRGAELYRVDLTRAVLFAAKLEGVILFRANLTEADLTDADLTGASLTDADLTGASLKHAVLSGADLSSAMLMGADFEDVKWDDRTMWPAGISTFMDATNIPEALRQQLGL